MPDPSTLRDSTQIILPSDALEGFRQDLNEQFTLTFFEVEGTTRDGNETSKDDGDESETADGAEDETINEAEGETAEGETADEKSETADEESEAVDEGETTDGNDGPPKVDYVRIIGSPVEIKAASDFLSRHGVSLR